MATKKTQQTPFEAQLTAFLQETFGEFVWDDSPENTAKRWMKAMREFRVDSKVNFKLTTFPAAANQMIIVQDIEFSSLCAHHLFPFSGVAHVAYLPNKKMIGLSKIPRIVHHFAERPCTQEKLTRAVASFLKDTVEAQGVAVVMKSQHTCMSCRGVKERNAHMITSEMRGSFLTSDSARSEFMRLIGESK